VKSLRKLRNKEKAAPKGGFFYEVRMEREPIDMEIPPEGGISSVLAIECPRANIHKHLRRLHEPFFAVKPS
jgi:hypothetical protein